jgi:hypothetical protein
MTAHEQHTDELRTQRSQAGDHLTAPTEGSETPPSAMPTDPTIDRPGGIQPTQPSSRQPEPVGVGGESTAEAAPAAATDDMSLFAEHDRTGFRTRWDDVQAAFVDDPRDCVQKADTLVSEVVDRLTQGFSDTRSRLETQWSRGEEASTEDLRLALKRYREFFHRLLEV